MATGDNAELTPAKQHGHEFNGLAKTRSSRQTSANLIK